MDLATRDHTEQHYILFRFMRMDLNLVLLLNILVASLHKFSVIKCIFMNNNLLSILINRLSYNPYFYFVWGI